MNEAYDHQADLAPAADHLLSQDEMEDLLESERQPSQVTYSTQDLPVDALAKRLGRGLITREMRHGRGFRPHCHLMLASKSEQPRSVMVGSLGF